MCFLTANNDLCYSMQLPAALATDYSKAQALDMSSQYYSTEPVKYPTPPSDGMPYTLAPAHTGDNPGIITPTSTAMFPRFPPYDRIEIPHLPKPGYEPENLSTTEALMRQYSTSSSAGSCTPYSPQDRLHPSAVSQQARGFHTYPSPQAVMNSTNAGGLPIFPWMRSNISGKFYRLLTSFQQILKCDT